MARSAIALALFVSILQGGPHPIKVFFRYDDYSARSDSELEKRLVELFRELGLKITVGVIPAVCADDTEDPRPQQTLTLTPAKVQLLREGLKNGTIELALHGYTHQTLGGPPFTEFRGLDATSQRNRISAGKHLLESQIGAEVSIFIPPWNSYDENTVRMVEDLGFRTLSAAFGAAPSWSYLKFAPVTCGLDAISEAVAQAKRTANGSRLVGVLLHDFEFAGYGTCWHEYGRGRRNKSVTTFERFAGQLRALLAEPDLEISSIGQLVTAGEDLTARRVALNRPPSLVLPLLYRPQERFVLISTDAAARRRLRNGVGTAVFYALVWVAGLLGGWLIRQLLTVRLRPRAGQLLFWIALGALACSVYYHARAGAIARRGLALVVFLTGLALAGLLGSPGSLNLRGRLCRRRP